MKIRFFLISSLFLLLMALVLARPDGKVRVIFCDVGQGDGIVVTKGDFQMVYDTGPDNKKILGCLERYTPFWDKKIEAVVISHWDSDHSGGLASLIDNYKIERIYSSSQPEKINEQISYTSNIGKGDVIKYGEIYFEILSPDGYLKSLKIDDNASSVVGVLSYKTKNILLTGDAEAEVEQRMVWRKVLEEVGIGGSGVVLKVSHHGSATATSKELLEAIKAEMAVISVGKGNSYGHPSKEVLERLKEYKVEVKRTDIEGDVVLVI